MNRHWTLRAGLLVAATTLAISGIGTASAVERCTNATLDGFYVFTASGFNIVNGVVLPVAIVELIRFTGDGTADVPGGRVSVNGDVFRTVSTGTYTVSALAPPNKGCEGTITFPGGINLYMFIPPGARDIQLIRTDAGTVFQGTATRVSK